MNFDNLLGIHETALKFRSQRAEMLANNLANADTPGFKAQDMDFSEALKSANQSLTSSNAATLDNHINMKPAEDFNTLYRVPTQDSIDGNTVDEQVEISAFSENALKYMASLRFIDGRLKSLMTAIKGD